MSYALEIRGLSKSFAGVPVLDMTTALASCRSERRWADVITLVRDWDEVLVQAAASGAILGPLGDSRRDAAPWRRVAPEELGPFVRLHPDLELRQYLDPATGRSLWLDFVRPGDEPLVDFRLSELER